MSLALEAIGRVAAPTGVLAPTASVTTKTAPAASGDFAAALGSGLERLDQSLRAADQAIVGIAEGSSEIAPHTLMVTLERARFELQFAVEVRNRALEAYQELLRMQV